MIFLRRLIISSCGLDFVFEMAYGDGFAIGRNFGNPFFLASVPGDAFVFRCAGVHSSYYVAAVLLVGCEAKIGLSIIKAVIVDVVND